MNNEWIYVKPPQRIEFLGEVKHRLTAADKREVELVVQPDQSLGFELARASLAIDGSRSMLRSFAAHMPKMIRRKQNKVHPIAQDLATFLAKNASNECAIAYWACGDDGSDIEPVGMMGTGEIANYEFVGAENWGGGTKLTPIVQYFWEQIFVDTTQVGIVVILTDGAWDDDDHQRLLELTEVMCRQVDAGERQLMKCIILGLKTDDNAGELERIDARFNAIDNYEAAADVDIWYTNWVDELEDWIDLFIELVKDWSLGVGGFIEANGQKVLQQDEFNFGIQFEVPANATSFTLHLDGLGDFSQEIV